MLLWLGGLMWAGIALVAYAVTRAGRDLMVLDSDLNEVGHE